MTKIVIRDNESLDKALRRLKRKVEREGVLKDLKTRKHYEKPSEKKRRKRKSPRLY